MWIGKKDNHKVIEDRVNKDSKRKHKVVSQVDCIYLSGWGKICCCRKVTMLL